MRIGIPVAVCALALVAGSPAGADEAEANRLLVEAARLADEAMRAPRDEAAALYAQAAANLDAIMSEHPDSTYAALIATNQPVGSFLPWQVRRELARLTADAASLAPGPDGPITGPCDGGPCVWERRYGDGTGNMLTGEGEAYLLADALPQPDGSVIVVGSRWAERASNVWVTGLDANGATLWEHQYPGKSCDAAPFAGGFVVLAEDLSEDADTGVYLMDEDGLRYGQFSVDYDAFAVATAADGGFLIGGKRDREPFVETRAADGSLAWTWTVPASALPNGAGTAAVTAVATSPDGVRLLGYQLNHDGGEDAATLWMATLDDNRELDALYPLAEFALLSNRTCELVSREWQLLPLEDDWLVRYTSGDSYRTRLSTVARVDAGGNTLWSATHPVSTADQPDPQAAMMAGVDEITAVSATRDGGVLVAGFRNRPLGNGAGFVTRWDGDGGEIWRSEVRWAADDASQEHTFFAAVEETADGGVVAAITYGLQTMRIRAFVLHLGREGTMP